MSILSKSGNEIEEKIGGSKKAGTSGGEEGV